jgi:hypothetical protein
MFNTLQDVIRRRGTPSKLVSKRAQVKISSRVKDILRSLIIGDWQSEPHQQHRNPAERKYQDVKGMANTIRRAIDECRECVWNNSIQSPYSNEGYRSLVPRGAPSIGTLSNTMALATTICWSDRTSGYRVGKHHSKWMTSVSSVVKMKHAPLTAREFALLGMKSMSSSSMKSSLQSDIGATSRRAKLGAERVYLNANRCVMWQTGEVGTLVPTQSRYPPLHSDGYFGNPTVRAVSRLCAASRLPQQNLAPCDYVYMLCFELYRLSIPQLAHTNGDTDWFHIGYQPPSQLSMVGTCVLEAG